MFDGFICLHDRRKDMIIRGGYNIYSAEVENALTGPPVRDRSAAAIGCPDPVLGEKMHVFHPHHPIRRWILKA